MYRGWRGRKRHSEQPALHDSYLIGCDKLTHRAESLRPQPANLIQIRA